MLPIFVVLCFASAQVWAVPGVSHSSSANEDVDYASRVAHTDGDGHLISSSKDYEYTVDRAADNSHNDYAADRVDGFGYVGGAANVAYDNDHSVTSDKSTGSGHEEALDHVYSYNNDEATMDASASAEANDDHNSNVLLYKRSVVHPGYFGHHGFLYKRSVVHPGYFGHRGYYLHKRSVVHPGYFGHHGYLYKRSVAHPAYFGHRGYYLHKRSVVHPGFYGRYGYVHKRSVVHPGYFGPHRYLYKRSVVHPAYFGHRGYFHKRSVGYGYPGYNGYDFAFL